jgi:pectinesterase
VRGWINRRIVHAGFVPNPCSTRRVAMATLSNVKFRFILFFLACASGGFSAPAKIRIALVGDSTVTDQAGWGLGFQQFVDPSQAEVFNTAQGGRSSMSFMKEGRWDRALALKADYYLIQFGHNDEAGKPGRSTTLEEYREYMTRYVEEAKAAGATPVLITSLVRRQFERDDEHRIDSSLEPRVAIIKEIAAKLQVPLVDLHARSKELCERLGRQGCLVFSPVKISDGKSVRDGTHLNREGYVLFGELVVKELRTAVPALAKVLLEKPRDTHPRAADSLADAIVSADGSGTYTTIQEAVTAAPDNAPKPFVILVKPGRYTGPILIPKTKRHLQLIGEDAPNTVLTYGLNVREPDPRSAKGFQGTGVAVMSDDFSAEQITFENTSGDHGQALALRSDGDRQLFRRCRFLGWQDTLMINNGRHYFVDCYIEGRVDFIYGSATAVFDHCEIHSKNGGHVTAASTPQDQPFGFVFLHCRLTGDPVPWDLSKTVNRAPLADLGRPWREFARVAYLECELGDHIKPQGWDNWGKPNNEKTARYVEYRSSGPGANPSARVPWSRQLNDEEARRYTITDILSGPDHWHFQKTGN